MCLLIFGSTQIEPQNEFKGKVKKEGQKYSSVLFYERPSPFFRGLLCTSGSSFNLSSERELAAGDVEFELRDPLRFPDPEAVEDPLPPTPLSCSGWARPG